LGAVKSLVAFLWSWAEHTTAPGIIPAQEAIMLTIRKKQKMWNRAKLAAVVVLGALILTPKDIDLSAFADFNPLVTQVQAAGL
jgi:hypothetical protein